MVQNKVHQASEAIKLMIYARDVDPNYGKTGTPSAIAIFTKTFSLSPGTTFEKLNSSACNYFGLIEQDFSLFWLDEESGKLTSFGEGEEGTKVLNFLEVYA